MAITVVMRLMASMMFPMLFCTPFPRCIWVLCWKKRQSCGEDEGLL